jgi:hypothetical protein
MSEVVYVDRYGPKGPPSTLRACGACDAMGCYPVHARSVGGPTHEGNLACSAPATTEECAAWWTAEAKEPAEDGWHFIGCGECGGSARVSWLRTLARVPGWLVGGARVFLEFRKHEPSAWMRFKICFLYDLGLSR